ncbi:MAG: hypothetical protein E7323_00095 [Clostridiales bacterium]|nr:hypothetical protein [Clostridiales bacterium]
MKRFLALLLCVLMCAACCSALAVEYNANNIFTITYDENAYAIDNSTYLEENTNEYIWMFMLYNEASDAVVDVAMEALPEFADLSLFSATAEERNSYVDATLEIFADANIKLLDTITVSDIQIPFYIYALEDENGAYLTAETVVNGWAINFSTYHMATSDADDALLNVLEEIVKTFQPVTE